MITILILTLLRLISTLDANKINAAIPNSVYKQDEIPDWKFVKPKFCVHDANYERPSEPINVSILLFVKSIYDISEEKMEFGLRVTIIELWRDPFLNVSSAKNIEDFEILPTHVVKCLWEPDSIFYNAKECYLYNDPMPNIYTALRSDGVLFRNARYRLTVSCNMQFHLYPMDSQYCSLEIGLLASTESEVRLRWERSGVSDTVEGVGLENEIHPQNFAIIFLSTNVTEKNWGKKKEFLYANFLFSRSLVASIVNTYIPSSLVVCLSFVSFYLDVNAVPGRVTLGVTALLTLASSISLARGSLPTLDYMTAMDVWLLACTIMVFLSLIEFTLAQALNRKYRLIPFNKNDVEKDEVNSAKKRRCRFMEKTAKVWRVRVTQKLGLRSKSSSVKKMESIHPRMKKPEIIQDNVLDRVSRFLFPLSFLIFVVTYWIYFLNKAITNKILQQFSRD